MDSERVVELLNKSLGAKIKEISAPNPRRVYVTLDPADIVECARTVHKELGCRFNIASGMQMQRDFEVLYHFAFEDDTPAGVVATLRVHLDEKAPSVESISHVVPAAEWIEREMRELLGIEFRNHPDMRRLLLAEDWPAEVYPLRRGKPWEGKIEKKL